jgi:hypothetical protein
MGQSVECSLCEQTFKNKRGLGVHMRSKHPQQYHAAKLSERVGREVKPRWDGEEIEMLARAEVAWEKNPVGRFINIYLAEKFPERTLEGIKGQRKAPAYKELVSKLRKADPESKSGDESVVPSSDNQSSPDENPEDDGDDSDGDGGGDSSHGGSGDEDVDDWRGAIRQWAQGELANNNSPETLEVLRAIVELAPQEICQVVEARLRALRLPPRLPREPRDNPVAEPNQDVGRRTQRKRDYARIQAMYVKDRSMTAEAVLSGKWRNQPNIGISKDDQIAFWRRIFDSEPKLDGRAALVPPRILIESLSVVEVDDARSLLKSLSTTAPGPDGIQNAVLKGSDPVFVAAILNALLLCGKVPESFTESRTVLIPKVQNPVNPGEFRPISISNAYCRLYHKFLAARLQRIVPIGTAQKAFRSVDGTAANLTILDTLLRDARNRRRNLSLAFLDLRKAFDSVSHQSIIRAAKAMGFPDHLVAYLRDYYASGETTLYGTDIRITNGVRQGDPLSPLLFNAVIDEAIKTITNSGIGYRLNDHLHQVLAFADDLVLVASTQNGLQENANSVLGCLGRSGLAPNAAKCATLCIRADGRNRRWLCDQGPFLRVGGEVVRAMMVDEPYKYLGIQITSTGRAQAKVEKLVEMLRHLKEAPLKPQQRIYILRVHAVPKMLHQLVLGRVTLDLLRKLDRTLRNAVREYLRLPHDTPVGFFHCQSPDGGLGIPSFRTSVPRLLDARVSNLTRCRDPDVVSIVQSRTFTEWWEKRVSNRYLGRILRNKDEEAKAWRDSLQEMRDGLGLKENAEVGWVNNWVTGGTRLLSGSSYIKCLKIRGNLWYTRARASRGRAEAAPFCDAGCNARETLGHMVQSCARTHDLRVQRHDRLNLYLMDRCALLGYQTHLEPIIPTTAGNRRPDVVLRKDGTIYVLDTSVVADSGAANLTDAYRRKTAYYRTQEITEWIRANLGQPGDRVVFGALIVNWRGALSRFSEALLAEIGLPRYDTQVLVVKSLEGTVRCAEIFMRRTTRRRNNGPRE